MKLLAGLKVPGGFRMLRRTLSIRDYRLYVIGNFTSYTGLWVQRIAIGWLAWQLTDSPAWLGIIAFADQFPTILLGLFAGALTDRMDYFKLLRITQALTVVYSSIMALLAFTGWIDIWSLLALTLFRGTIVAFNRPSRMTVIYHLVGRDLLPSAVSLNSLIFNLSRFIGPAIGGAIIVVAGVGWAFAIGALMFLVFTLCLRLMNAPAVPLPEASHKSILADSMEGLRYVLRHPGIRMQMALLTTTSMFARPLTDMFPGFADEVFDNGAHGLALLQSAQGIGAMAGGALMLSYSRLKGLTRLTLGNILVMSLTTLAFTMTGADLFWLACILIGGVGYALTVQSTSNQVLIQSAVSPDMRGRVLGLYGLVARGGPALGALLMGIAAEHFGLRAPVIFGALLCLLLWIWAWPRRAALAAALENDPRDSDDGKGGLPR
jgi:MFS family permease